MPVVLIALWTLAGALWASGSAAQASDRSTVVLLDPGQVELSRRLREEIESLGLDVKMVAPLLESESLEARAREAGAVAAIRVTDAGTRAVEMTIVDRTTGKIVSRRLAINTPDDPAAAELIATRTVELLRASLMELAAPHPVRGDIGITPEIEALAPPPRAEEALDLAIAVGPASLYSPDFTLGLHMFAGVTVLARGLVGLNFALIAPLTGARLQSGEGAIELFASEYRLGGTLHLLNASSILRLRFQAGVLMARLALSGEASSPYYGAQDSAIAWGPWLGAALRLKLSSSLGLLVDGSAALSYPRTIIRAAGRELTTWGRPVFSGATALELSWP